MAPVPLPEMLPGWSCRRPDPAPLPYPGPVAGPAATAEGRQASTRYRAMYVLQDRISLREIHYESPTPVSPPRRCRRRIGPARRLCLYPG